MAGHSYKRSVSGTAAGDHHQLQPRDQYTQPTRRAPAHHMVTLSSINLLHTLRCASMHCQIQRNVFIDSGRPE